MAEHRTEGKRRIVDWLIVAFVLTVMALLVVELGRNVLEVTGRAPAQGAPASEG